MISGPDVSSYQGQVDWQAVQHSGRSFGFCKATEGVSYVDKFLARNRSEMARLGFALVGLYDFGRTNHAAADEANHFLHAIGSLAPHEVCVLDLETNDGKLNPQQLGQWAATWLDIVANATGKKPGLYSYLPFLKTMDTVQLVSRSWLWVAAYQSKPPATDRWPSYTFWQHTDKASIPGISGTCDENYFHSDDMNELAALAGGGTDMPLSQDDLAAVKSVVQDIVIQILRAPEFAVGARLADIQQKVDAGGGGAAPTYTGTVELKPKS